MKRPRVLFPGPNDDAEDGDADALDVDADGDDIARTKDDVDGAPSRRKRSRAKRIDEGDSKELKPRHLRGKRRDEVEAASRTRAVAEPAALKACAASTRGRHR
jgi:hypothetical protein